MGASFGGHCGLSDAKVPGCEAGVQKLTSVLFNAAACGEGNFAAGLLGIDEIFSPIQMILEDEIVGSLKRICEGMDTSDESLALDTILEEGPGAMFLGTEHTLLNFRKALWEPNIWSKSMFSNWNSGRRKNDIDKAKEKYFTLIQDVKPLESLLTEKAAKRLREIISKHE